MNETFAFFLCKPEMAGMSRTELCFSHVCNYTLKSAWHISSDRIFPSLLYSPYLRFHQKSAWPYTDIILWDAIQPSGNSYSPLWLPIFVSHLISMAGRIEQDGSWINIGISATGLESYSNSSSSYVDTYSILVYALESLCYLTRNVGAIWWNW